MDSTPRASQEPVTGRGSPMVKENPSLSSGFQAQAPPPRYPLNNGSVGRPPRLPGAQPDRVDGTPLGWHAGGPPLGVSLCTPNPRLNPVQATRGANFTNPQGAATATPAWRFPGVPGSPGIRPLLSNVGPRPPPLFVPPNQPIVHYQPPNEIRPRSSRPLNLDSQIRFSSFPQNPGIRRHLAQQAIPETHTATSGLVPRPAAAAAAAAAATPRATVRPQGEKMQAITDSPPPSAARARSETGPANKSSGITENEDNDDDDVIMDRENYWAGGPQTEYTRVDSPGSRSCADSVKKSTTPSSSPTLSRGPDDPEHRDPPKLMAKMGRETDEKLSAAASESCYKISPTTSPLPLADHAASVQKDVDESPGSKNSYKLASSMASGPIAGTGKLDQQLPGFELSASSVETADKSGSDKSRSESRLGEPKSPNRYSPENHSTNFQQYDEQPTTLVDEINDTRAGQPSTSPPPLFSSSSSSSSPHSSAPSAAAWSKSPLGSVKGFDNGRLTSLSPGPSSVSPKNSSPANLPNSPSSSAILECAEGDDKKATFTHNETEIERADREKRKEKSSNISQQTRPASPGDEARARPTEAPATPDQPSSVKRSTSGRSIKSDAGSDSGANQTNQATPTTTTTTTTTTNGVGLSPTKKLPSRDTDKRTTAGSPVKSPSKTLKSLPRTPEAGPPSTATEKKIPMNKVQVGAAPSPNLKTVRSKIGSLENASYKPGGGKVKIENRKLDFSKAQPKIAAKNDKYTPSGGDKKITCVKLQWNAKPKVGSLDNATYKPGGGDKKIETVKLDFKDKAKPKVGSKDNAKHVPGGGTVKSSSTPQKFPQDSPNDIETQKMDIKAESKIGSLDNVKHKPGGGDKKIFDDRDYLRQQTAGSNVESLNGSGAQIEPVPMVAERPSFIESSLPCRRPRRHRRSSAANPAAPSTTGTSSSESSAPVSPLTPGALRKSLQPESPTIQKLISDSSSTTTTTTTTTTTATTETTTKSSSPKGLCLPELTTHASSADNNQAAAMAKQESNMKLPKLVSARLELAQ